MTASIADGLSSEDVVEVGPLWGNLRRCAQLVTGVLRIYGRSGSAVVARTASAGFADVARRGADRDLLSCQRTGAQRRVEVSTLSGHFLSVTFGQVGWPKVMD